MDEKIVLIGGESHTSKFISEFLVSDGYDYTAVRDGYSALNVIRETHPGVVLIDYGFRGENIIELVQEIKEIGPETVVVVFSSSASIKAAVEAIKAGAFDFVPKPLSPEQLKLVVDNALNTSEKCKVQKRHYALVQETYILDRIVGKSQVMQNIFRKILKVAKSNANVLISGESGTGKELVARSIHSRSPRSQGAFIPMDCGALPETLLEAGLFGHERGSFTGAISTKRGLFELAHKGTLFLDEITELSMNLQAKLLRVLQEQEFRRVGGSKNIRVDVRVISATNIDPEQALLSKKLREDLYYRLNVIHLHLPPLRERKEDIPLLAYHFMRHFGQHNNVRVERISNKALNILEKYDWPGNVRELQNAIERAVCLANTRTIKPDDLPEKVRSRADFTIPQSFSNLTFKEAKNQVIKAFERQYLANMLRKYKGNISKIAKAAHLNRRTVYRLLENYEIPSDKSSHPTTRN